MAIYCVKKICAYNSACCTHNKDEVHYCTLGDILINAEVECDNFKGEYKKLDECEVCLAKKGLLTFKLDETITNPTIQPAKPFDPSKFNKK